MASNNGSSGDDTLIANSGGSTMNGGAGDDTLIGAEGSDRLNGGSGDDLFIYNVSQNGGGTADVYTGGSGVDTVLIEFTLAQWLDASVQAQIASYLAHLAQYTNAKTGQVSNGAASDFTFRFGSSTLTVQMMERLRVTVDGVELNPADEAVTAQDDTAGAVEDGPAIVIDVLANDDVPDLVKDLAVEVQPAHGAVTLVQPDPANPATWRFEYQADAAYYQYLAAGETATDTFTYTVTDANGDTDSGVVTITITGTNDAPTISAAVASGSVTEDASAPDLTASGTITFDDVDLIDAHTASVAASDSNALGGTLIATVTTDATGAGAGTVTWQYSVSNAAVQSLASNQSVTETFLVTIADGHGGTVTQGITITVHGADEAPVGPTGGADRIITNIAPGTAFAVAEWALLANDTLDGPGTLDVDSVSGASGLGVTHQAGTGADGTVTITDTGPAGGSFEYRPTDGSTPGPSTQVSVTVVAGTLEGTSGNDILVGSNGSTYVGGAGDDILLGGGGNDTYNVALADGHDTIADAGGGNDTVRLTASGALATLNFERVGDDLEIVLGDTTVTIRNHFAGASVENIGFASNTSYAGYALGSAYRLDTDLSGAGTADVIASSSANHVATGGNGNDLLFGNGGDDTLDGGGGNDLLVGGTGADRLLGGAGNDVLLGGAGSDVFVFSHQGSGNADQVRDFDATGVDRIELSAAAFAGIGGAGGTLAAANFASVSGDGAAAIVGAGVNVVFDSLSGNLYYDANGGDAGNRSLIATITIVGGMFDASDIVVGL